MALNFISGSTFRILSGATIITTLIFCKILLKTMIVKTHIVGCGLAFIGLIIVGISGFIDKPSDSSSDTTVSL
jgi:drug/metabolite transporter (DMT)-like permease